MDSKAKLATEAGIPVGDNQNSQSPGPGGPLSAQDRPFLSKD